MFEVKYIYDPCVKHHQNGEMSVSISLSNGKKSKIVCNLYDKNYEKLMKSVKSYVEFENSIIESSFKLRMKKLLSLYI